MADCLIQAHKRQLTVIRPVRRTEFGSWTLILPLFAADKDLVKFCSELDTGSLSGFAVSWPLYPVPPILSFSSSLHTQLPSETGQTGLLAALGTASDLISPLGNE